MQSKADLLGGDADPMVASAMTASLDAVRAVTCKARVGNSVSKAGLFGVFTSDLVAHLQLRHEAACYCVHLS